METMQTKRCPYCGEEILEAAIKCKHCGEWLNGAAPDKPVQHSSDYTWVSVICCIAIFFVIISMLQDLPLYESPLEDGSKSGVLMDFVNLAREIPQWFVYVVMSAMWGLALFGLWKFCRERRFDTGPLLTLIGIIAGTILLGLLETGGLIELNAFKSLKYYLLYVLILNVPLAVVGIMVGSRLLENTPTRTLGTLFIVKWIVNIVFVGFSCYLMYKFVRASEFFYENATGIKFLTIILVLAMAGITITALAVLMRTVRKSKN